jgi:hypothetical protein
MPPKEVQPDESKINHGSKLDPRKTVEWLEVPVFIHGISPDKYPGGGEKEYLQLYKLVREKLAKYPGKKFNGQPIFVTWGVPTRPASSGTDRYLAQVERSMQARVKKKMGKAYSSPFGLTGYIRDLLFFGIADLFYYVSADGEKDLRKHVFNHISRAIQIMDKENVASISLTFFAHSAGSVMIHDMLYHMFSSKEHESEEGVVEEEMDALRKIIKGGRLRIRRLYTFGSPISLLILRASALIEKFRKGETFAPHNIGLMMGDNLSTPRWVNFWSRHDMASYPVDFLYSNEKGLIEDREINTSINPKTAHTGYWTNSEMAEYISETF